MATKFRKIATEEAFSIPEVAEQLKLVSRFPGESLDLQLVKGIYDRQPGYGELNFLDGLLDLEKVRLRDMDENGVDMHILSLTAPGVQMFDADTATELATLANDRLAEVISRHPTRFAGLATFAPQSPKRAAKEMERAITKLKLNGFILNSHTNSEYLDNPKYWPVLPAPAYSFHRKLTELGSSAKPSRAAAFAVSSFFAHALSSVPIGALIAGVRTSVDGPAVGFTIAE